MKQTSTDPTRQTNPLKDLLGLIEQIRYKRYNDWRDKPHELGHKFTQLELTQEVLPTYGNLLAGRSQRLPSRPQVMQIADYLECNLSERNDLLLTADYRPEALLPTGAALDLLLFGMVRTIEALPLPAHILDHVGRVYAANECFLKVSELSPVEREPAQWREMPHTTFNPQVPFHRLLKATATAWQINARTTVGALKRLRPVFRNEIWYRRMIEDAQKLPDFETFYHDPSVDRLPSVPLHYLTYHSSANSLLETEVLTLCPLGLPLPSLFIFLPKNGAAKQVYQQLGFHLPEGQPFVLPQR